MAAQPQLVSGYKCLYGQCRQAEYALGQLQQRAAKGHTDQEFMQFQLKQIDNAQLQEEEQQSLEAEQQILSHAEDIKQGLFTARNLLTNEDSSISQQIRLAIDALESITENFENASGLADRLKSTRIELDDIEAELETEADRVEYDPTRLGFVEERLNIIYELEQKHNVTSIKELLSIAEKLRVDLDAIETLMKTLSAKRQKLHA